MNPLIEACAEGDLETVQALVSQYAEYLRTVEIVHVDVPAPTWREVPFVVPIGEPL
jgi:hypothetical protein